MEKQDHENGGLYVMGPGESPLAQERGKRRTKKEKENDRIEAELKQRCAAINSPESPRFSYERSALFGTINFRLFIHLGKELLLERLLSADEVGRLLNQDLEKYTFLPGYRAICSYENGDIEAEIRPIINIRPRGSLFQVGISGTQYILGRLSGEKSPEKLKYPDKYPDFQLSDENRGITLRIGESSPLFSLLFHSQTTIKIIGLKLSKISEAIDYLEQISNAAFFWIDLKFALPLNLVKSQFSQTGTFVYSIKPQFPHKSFDNTPYRYTGMREAQKRCRSNNFWHFTK